MLGTQIRAWVSRMIAEGKPRIDQGDGSAVLSSRGRRPWLFRQRLTLSRNAVQLSFALFLLYAGWQFSAFVAHFESGAAEPFVSRPSAVDAFLPISALVALKGWWGTGMVDRIHPAGVAIFLAVVAVSVLFKKGFCSWICPIGTVSEALARAGRHIFGRSLEPPNFLDFPLRGIKYLLLGLFAYMIPVAMAPEEAAAFLLTPYNRIADVKMLYFFTRPGPEIVAFLVALALISALTPYFWCRYLCPYGALLGLASLISPVRVARHPSRCVDCAACTRACPNRIQVAQASTVSSPECTGCLACVEACPRQGALTLSAGSKSRAMPTWLFPVLLLGTFFGILLLFQAAGLWESGVSYSEYADLIPRAGQFSH